MQCLNVFQQNSLLPACCRCLLPQLHFYYYSTCPCECIPHNVQYVPRWRGNFCVLNEGKCCRQFVT